MQKYSKNTQFNLDRGGLGKFPQTITSKVKPVEWRVWRMDIRNYSFFGNFNWKWSRQKRALNIEITKKNVMGFRVRKLRDEDKDVKELMSSLSTVLRIYSWGLCDLSRLFHLTVPYFPGLSNMMKKLPISKDHAEVWSNIIILTLCLASGKCSPFSCRNTQGSL